MTISPIFTWVQTKVEGEYLGRVLDLYLSYTIMPIATGLMTWLPSVHLYSFSIIGLELSPYLFLALWICSNSFEKLI